MIAVVILISVVVLGVAYINWRNGIVALLVIGVLQDPLRKLTPDAPASYILWSGGIFGVIVILAWLNKAIKNARPLSLGSQRLQNAWQAFFLLIVFQSLNSFVRWDSVPLVVLGLVFYLTPVVALLLSIAYVKSEKEMLKFIRAYTLIMVPAALTVYLSAWYPDVWPVLRDVGSFNNNALVIYDFGEALESYPGLFRVGEIAAWHAATASCFLIILMRRYPSVFFKVLGAVLIVLLVGAIILTGRRKMIMALSIFLFMQWGLLIRYKHGGGRQGAIIMLLGLMCSFVFVLLDEGINTNSYVLRGKTVFQDAGDRLLLSYRLMESALYRSEWIGLGAGVTSQGSRFVGIESGASGAAEAGTGMIVVELGVPGALVLLWLVVAMARRLFSIFERLARNDEKLLYYAVSFFALLVANMGTFLNATQIYSDPFVLVVLGLIAGFLIWACRNGTSHYRATTERTPLMRASLSTVGEASKKL